MSEEPNRSKMATSLPGENMCGPRLPSMGSGSAASEWVLIPHSRMATLRGQVPRSVMFMCMSAALRVVIN